MSIITAERLVKMASFKKLTHSWYYIACATLTVCNEPQEIQKILHFALRHSLVPEESISPANLQLMAQKSIKSSAHYTELSSSGTSLPDITFYDNSLTQTQHLLQFDISQKIRESLLKSAALNGLPKVINSLMLLKTVTPLNLREKETQRDFSEAATQEERERGIAFWRKVYGKISNRVINQMETAYPDLWHYTINHVYAPLLSYSKILTPAESSLVVIACLVPQDVNPQLKGHLKGALNNGCSPEEIEEARSLAIEIGSWCGVKWKGEIAKL